MARWTKKDCAHLPSSHCRYNTFTESLKISISRLNLNYVWGVWCYFLLGTIEERIFQRQVSKQGLSGTVVDMGKGAEHTSFSTSELRDLFSLTETHSLTHDLLNCGCSMDGTVNGMLINPAHTSWHCYITRLITCLHSLLSSAMAEEEEEEEEQVSDRPCQLGRQGDRRGPTQKHLSMSELMQWKHFSGDTHTFSDPYLDHARSHITFAFQTTISHTAQ